ncbi:aspartic peptidase domain-containing protein [Podospora didyma]|uniref:Aspartic peptidase domain-containing protein n=1 Tax=Podospora didyma TaxID=330526 RepID=A0AAE0P4I0_9PEZI|nr:aspartic peptidase domain-containing protein [Podospora didyma]
MCFTAFLLPLLVAILLPATGSNASVLLPTGGNITSLARRGVESTLFNVSTTSYLIQLAIGTPGQSVKVAIDTGSDELWVDPNCRDRTLELDQMQECSSDGTYTPKTSSSSNQNVTTAETNTIHYGKGAVKIVYFRDNIALSDTGSAAGGSSVTNAQFGVASASTELNEGILGLGFGRGANLNYSNFIDELADQQVTNSRAFSVALGSADASNGGVIIFGGVDTKKFTGKLQSNPLLPPQFTGDIHRYYVQMNSTQLRDGTTGSTKTYSNGNPNNKPIAVVLDSGSSLSYLPLTMLTAMAADFDGVVDVKDGIVVVPCSNRSLNSTLVFNFGSGTISVPARDFVVPVDSENCILGAGPSDPSSGLTALLGDTFMRSAYVVFDQTTKTISLAQYANCGQNPQTIPATGAGNFVGECDASAAASAHNNAAAAVPGHRAGLCAVLVAFAAGIVAVVL